MNLSFAGCGFLGIYHVGVASCFKEYAPNILVNSISGTSAGAIAACGLMVDLPLGAVTSDILKVATDARSYTLGPFNPKFNVVRILRERMTAVLPDNAHITCSGRLHISVTRLKDGKNVILSQFDSKEELIQALLCSSFIPFFSGYFPPPFKGVWYLDGGFSDNSPVLDDNTVTVSPFCGESDICPRDNTYNLLQVNVANTSIELSAQNLVRMMRILFPPPAEILSQMCKQGFDDALRFLQRNDMISCTRCIAVDSKLSLRQSEPVWTDDEEPISDLDEGDDSDDDGLSDSASTGRRNSYSRMRRSQLQLPACSESRRSSCSYLSIPYHLGGSCHDCRIRKQFALLGQLPETVINALEDACVNMNKGLINWIFQHKSMRVLSILTLPYVLPADIAYVTFVRFMEVAPELGKDLQALAEWLVSYLKMLFKKLNRKRHLYSAKFSCQLAITEFNYNSEEAGVLASECSSPIASKPSSPQSFLSTAADMLGGGGSRILGKVNFGFTVDLSSNMIENELSPGAEELGMGSGPSSLSNSAGSFGSTSRIPLAVGADKEEEVAVGLANAALQLDSQVLESSRNVHVRVLPSDGDCLNRSLSVGSDLSATEVLGRVSRACSRRQSLHDAQGAVGQLLGVTARQEKSLMAYYYVDETKKTVNVTEIFDATSQIDEQNEDGYLNPIQLPANERQLNADLQWDETAFHEQLISSSPRSMSNSSDSTSWSGDKSFCLSDRERNRSAHNQSDSALENSAGLSCDVSPPRVVRFHSVPSLNQSEHDLPIKASVIRNNSMRSKV